MRTLPANYTQSLVIDLMKSRVMAVLSLLTLGFMLLLGILLCPKGTFTIIGFRMLLYPILLLAVAIAYMVLHELIHGAAMYAFSGCRVHYGFNGVAAYAGSAAYFTRRQYVLIALLPVALLGALLLAVNILLYPKLFWFVYIIQMLNVSGAAGDLYVTARIGQMPNDTLVRDNGTVMTFYSAKTAAR